jgi:hypothetical protein
MAQFEVLFRGTWLDALRKYAKNLKTAQPVLALRFEPGVCRIQVTALLFEQTWSVFV